MVLLWVLSLVQTLMIFEDIFCSISALVPSRRLTNSVVVLCYHRLVDNDDESSDRFTISRTTFSRQVNMIMQSGFDVIGPDQFWQVEQPAVMITFDDNLESHLRVAAPVLADFDATGIFFLSPADLGSNGQLSQGQVDELLTAGMWVGAHNNRHVVASSLTPEDFESEVALSGEYLDSLGMPFSWAYPGGHIGSYTKAHDEILLRQGFDLRFSSVEGPCNSPDPKRVQGRYVIRKNSSDRYFRSALAGGLQLIRVYKKARAKIRQPSRSVETI